MPLMMFIKSRSGRNRFHFIIETNYTNDWIKEKSSVINCSLIFIQWQTIDQYNDDDIYAETIKFENNFRRRQRRRR